MLPALLTTCAVRFPQALSSPPLVQPLENRPLPGFLLPPRQNGTLGLACFLSGMILAGASGARGGGLAKNSEMILLLLLRFGCHLFRECTPLVRRLGRPEAPALQVDQRRGGLREQLVAIPPYRPGQFRQRLWNFWSTTSSFRKGRNPTVLTREVPTLQAGIEV